MLTPDTLITVTHDGVEWPPMSLAYLAVEACAGTYAATLPLHGGILPVTVTVAYGAAEAEVHAHPYRVRDLILSHRWNVTRIHV